MDVNLAAIDIKTATANAILARLLPHRFAGEGGRWFDSQV